MSITAPTPAKRADSRIIPLPKSHDSQPTVSWGLDIAIAVALFAFLAVLRPLAPDGDGIDHAERAVNNGFLKAMTPKHLLYSPVLRGVYLAVEAVGLRRYTIEAFTFTSNLAGALLYLLLARAVFSSLVRDARLARLAALATLFSFGVMSECVAIETYSLALLMDVALVAVCLNCDLSTWRGGVGAGLLYALAVGIHVTNVLLLPFVLVLLYRDARKRSLLTSGWFAGTVFTAAVLLAVGVLVGQGARLWPPDWRSLIPVADPDPAMSVFARLCRAAYGVARTLAWLPPSWELTRAYAACYAVVLALGGALFFAVARRGLYQNLGRYRVVWLLSALLAAPYLVLGVCYYPSDPERWLFLTPLFWLVVALAWHEYRPTPGAWLSPVRACWLLVAVVVALAAGNTLLKLWPDAHTNRDYTGMKALGQEAKAGDLVIGVSGKSEMEQEFILHERQEFDAFAIGDLMLRDHRTDVNGGQEELRTRIRAALAEGRRVLVFMLIDENLAPGRGYPWSFVADDGYTPETILTVLREFDPEPVRPPTEECGGIYRLRGEK